MARNVAETKFIDEFTRYRLVTWARDTLLEGSFTVLEDDQEYLDYALSKSWASSKNGENRVLSKGYDVATSRLKKGG